MGAEDTDDTETPCWRTQVNGKAEMHEEQREAGSWGGRGSAKLGTPMGAQEHGREAAETWWPLPQPAPATEAHALPSAHTAIQHIY